ncbi:uncharacterized protein AB9X84_012734 isoform 2-T4 [Acanthopagrus schlegelii]
MTKEQGDGKGPETITASPDLDPAGGSPELGAQTVAGGGREPGAEIEAGNHKLGAGAEAHSCEGDSLREFTGSCTKRELMAFSSSRQRCGSEQEELPISHPDRKNGSKILTSATGTNNLANK